MRLISSAMAHFTAVPRMPLFLLVASLYPNTSLAAADLLAPVQITATPVSLVSPDTDTARQQINQTPGGVELIDAEQWRDTPSTTIKDVLDFTPGVIAQPKWGDDTRLSIRGSGLSRSFHLRGVQLYQDGVPLNTADGSGDFQEIDPSGYRYVEVFKGSNALRYGANALGGAINLVTPTGYNANRFSGRIDAGSFGYSRLQVSGATVQGKADGYITASTQQQDGYRDHSSGDNTRLFTNGGWRFNDSLETRLYLNLTDATQEIPGSTSKYDALHNPTDASPRNVLRDYQRNVKSVRIANKTSWQRDNTLYEFGLFAMDKSLIHPIFRYLDYRYNDQGGFVRATHEGLIGNFDNRLIVGATLHNGDVDSRQYTNLPGGNKGALASKTLDSSSNTIVYAENAFSITPRLQIIAGLQHLDAERKREDTLNPVGGTSGEASYYFTTPKLGLLWQTSALTQLFANVSQSAEAPTFGELNFTNSALADLDAQRATTVELGGRGGNAQFNWSLSAYRAKLKNEFQYFDLGGGNYAVTNADRTLHQGIEAAFGWRFLDGVIRNNDSLEWHLAWTHNDFRFDGDDNFGDNDIPGAPSDYIRSEVLYRLNGFFAGPGTEMVPKAYYVDNANTLGTSVYTLINLRAGYEQPRYSIYIDGRNLFDERYIASASTTGVASANQALFEPGTGRAVFAGFQWKL